MKQLFLSLIILLAYPQFAIAMTGNSDIGVILSETLSKDEIPDIAMIENSDIGVISAETLASYFKDQADNLNEEARKARSNLILATRQLDWLEQRRATKEEEGSYGLFLYNLYIDDKKQNVTYFEQQAIDYERDAQEAEMLARYFEQQSSSD